jgi:hypothetical protein
MNKNKTLNDYFLENWYWGVVLVIICGIVTHWIWPEIKAQDAALTSAMYFIWYRIYSALELMWDTVQKLAPEDSEVKDLE